MSKVTKLESENRKKELLEEGTEFMLDFGKLKKICRKGRRNVSPVIIQDIETKEVLMLGYTDRKAFEYTMANKRVAFWSTSRNELWKKGESSGCYLELIGARINCEQNSLLYMVRPKSGTCHTKLLNGSFRNSCFYRIINPKSSHALKMMSLQQSVTSVNLLRKR
jgi:phosphoribosyl-AMP cyclohydrolase